MRKKIFRLEKELSKKKSKQKRGEKMELFVILEILDREKAAIEYEQVLTLQKMKQLPAVDSIERNSKKHTLYINRVKLNIIKKLREQAINTTPLMLQYFPFGKEKALDSSTLLLAAAAEDYVTAYNMAYYLSNYGKLNNYEKKLEQESMSLEEKEKTLKELQSSKLSFFELACDLVGYDAMTTEVPYTFSNMEGNMNNIIMAFELFYCSRLEKKINAFLEKSRPDVWNFGRKKIQPCYFS